jgi:ribosomal-protein-alanine N-acetyltransferase
MSALPSPPDLASLRLDAMTLADLPQVLAIEQSAYAFPWTRGNFVDSLAAGHPAQVLRTVSGGVQAYVVAQRGVQELHLLNLTVAPPLQGRGLARVLLDALVAQARRDGDDWLWLEVRESNQRAREIYLRYGFDDIGLRRGYYPAAAGRREDARVMRLAITPPDSPHALD